MDLFSFGLGIDSPETSKEVLGGKGAGLVWMDKQGVSVPPGFIIPTSVCGAYMKDPAGTMAEVATAIVPWMKRLSEKFGYVPLVSVRSGARQSMPGMMDTILNVGLDEETAEAWVARIGKACVADSRRRLIEMFGSVVHGIERKEFEGLDAAGARDLFVKKTGLAFPAAPGQLLGAIEAVFKSWNNERAKVYRAQNNIPENWGTAVTVQAMVFGNLNDKSCTGVLFTRNCNTGEAGIVGEWLENAQGEDVVAGIRTPKPLKGLDTWNGDVACQLGAIATKLEALKADAQDIEFTVQDGKLFILQTRDAKRSSRAAIRIAVEMFAEGMLPEDELFARVKYKDYLNAKLPTLDPKFKEPAKFTGIPACSGIVTGKVVMSSEDAVAAKEPVILVTQETTPDDIAGMAAARGVLTMTGGATSHAAVVARGMNKPCVCGLSVPLSEFVEGQEISICGATGRVWMHPVPVVDGAADEWVVKFEKMMQAKVGVKIVDDQVGEALDLSGFYGDLDGAVKAVTESLKVYESVVVDVRPPSSPAHERFYSLFGQPDEAAFTKAIVAAVGKTKVKFLASKKIPGAKMVAIACKPEEIVMAEGDFLCEAPSAPWVEKLLAMKEKIDNARPIRLGQAVKGGYVSRVQLAAALLK